MGSSTGRVKPNTIKLLHVFVKNTALRRKSKDWLARNQNNVSEWSNMSTRGLLSGANPGFQVRGGGGGRT